MGLHQIFKLLQSKGNNQQSEQAIYRIRKKNVSHICDKGLISTIYKELKLKKTTTTKKKPQFKNEQRI